MRRSLAKFSESEASNHTPSLADFTTTTAELKFSVHRGPKPGDSDPITDLMCRDVAADEVDAADDFVARNDGIFDAGKLRIDHMKIGPANATRAHLDTNFSVAGHGVRALYHLERYARGRQHHRTHLFLRKEPSEQD